MCDSSEINLATQTRLVMALFESCQPLHAAGTVRLIETHISWVLLAGPYAYKFKKALNPGFLDFTKLERRRFFCEEEIRLNRRLAPKIYLDVVPIGGTTENPVAGAEPAIEYAVRMRRFPPSTEMDRLMARGMVLPAHVDSLANILSKFHQSLQSVPAELPYGAGAKMRDLALQNFEQLPESLLDTVGKFVVAALQHATEEEYADCEMTIESRRRQGFVRECHGDLHLGNIIIKGGKAVPFDCIEFDPALRHIDVICDLAFPFMDMLYFKRPDLAYRFLNGWLEITGDYAGLAVLRFYASYRAAVRAKVNAIRAVQTAPGQKKEDAKSAFRKYLAQAFNCLTKTRPVLIITHGLPGSGKTTFAQIALERLGAIRIRSDVERKRLFGLSPLERSDSVIGSNIYNTEATARTYEVLLKTARNILSDGYSVIVDAAFLKYEERDQFRKLASELSVRFIITSIHADEQILRKRIEQRKSHGKDASEADLNVLAVLQASSKPLEDDELGRAITFFNADSGFSPDDPGWSEIEKLLS